jgi:translation initiation factor eIF-2B subunit gamma
MPHATLPSPGFQAIILCGPGASFSTFTSTPRDIPKALLPVANRPMVWYPLEWCYRMGVTDITVVTPPESLDAIEAAMSQNPHLTTLPAPRPAILAPKHLSHETGTGDLFRLPEVQQAIKGDFIVLPCDLVCELDGTALADAWMVEQAGFPGAVAGNHEIGGRTSFGSGGEKLGRRGGLGVWYQTKGEGSKKGEETDFIATTPLPAPTVPAPTDSLRRHISNLVYSVPTDTLKDITDEEKTLPVRHSLIRKHARIRMLTTHRDAHIYFFPYWVAEMIKKNEKFENISEEVLGWWAKAGWQEGLGDKLGLRQIFEGDDDASSDASQVVDEEIDVSKFSTTYAGGHTTQDTKTSTILASRVLGSSSIPSIAKTIAPKTSLTVPPILAYVQPSAPTNPLIRRVDTAHLLLTVSLRLAKLPSIEEAGRDASPFAHPSKVANKQSIPKRCRVEAENSLVADNVVIEEKTNIKESVIGSNCKISEGARLLRCLLMDGVEIGPNVQLTDCILGRRCKIEGGGAKDADKTVLKDCEVQDGQVVEWGSEYFPCNCGALHQLTTIQLNRRTRNSCASTLETVSTTTPKTGSVTMTLALLMSAKPLICRSRSQLRWLVGWNGNIDMNDTRNLLLANFLKRR